MAQQKEVNHLSCMFAVVATESVAAAHCVLEFISQLNSTDQGACRKQVSSETADHLEDLDLIYSTTALSSEKEKPQIQGEIRKNSSHA